MMRFLSKLVLAAGVVIAPLMFAVSVIAAGPAKAPNWQLFGASSYYSVEVDADTIKVNMVNGGWEIWSKLRIIYFHEIETTVNGKKVKGAYSISETTAVCKDDKLVIHTSSLYNKAHKVLATRVIGDVPNPRDDDSFITAFIEVVCHGAKNIKPPMTV